MYETPRNPTAQELFQMWNDWEDVPDIPNIDANQCNNIDFLKAFQELLLFLHSKAQLAPNDYLDIRTLQQSFVIYLSNYDYRSYQSILLPLHNLSNLCIWKYPKSEIVPLLNQIIQMLPTIIQGLKKLSTFQQYDQTPQEKPASIESNQPSPWISKNNYTGSITRSHFPKSKSELNHNSSNYQNAFKSLADDNDSSDEFELTLQQDWNLSPKTSNNNIESQQTFSIDAEKVDHPNQSSSNDFQNRDDDFDFSVPFKQSNKSAIKHIKQAHNATEIHQKRSNYEMFQSQNAPINTDKLGEHYNRLLILLNVDNGIIHSETTNKIRIQIQELKKRSNDHQLSQILAQELDYLKGRSMIPYEHARSLRKALLL